MLKAPADMRATSLGDDSNGASAKLSTRMYAAQKPSTAAATTSGTPGSAMTAISANSTNPATATDVAGRASSRSGTNPITNEAGTWPPFSAVSAAPSSSG